MSLLFLILRFHNCFDLFSNLIVVGLSFFEMLEKFSAEFYVWDFILICFDSLFVLNRCILKTMQLYVY